MTTAEDVWYLYEKKNRYEDLIQHNNENIIQYEEENYDYDYDKDLYGCPIIPDTIGNIFNKCNFNRKVYIKPGEECCICLDIISKKTNAYLTGCGHSFHKKCLFKSYEVKRKSNPNCTLNCPLCRAHLGLDIRDLAYRYSPVPDRYLDNLENYWLRNDFMCCDICPNKKNHYIGMKKDCNTCMKYQNGDILFGL
jgi:hypothetical protein